MGRLTKTEGGRRGWRKYRGEEERRKKGEREVLLHAKRESEGGRTVQKTKEEYV